MNDHRTHSRAEVVDEVSKWAVGLGIVVVALFPLSIPILILTLAALVPLAVPLLALGVLAVPVLLARRLVRRLRRGGRPGPRPEKRSGPLPGAAPIGPVNAERAG
jgi:hypothetical protein